VEKEPLGLWFLRVFSRAFLTVLIPLYGGYVGAPIVTLLAYIFAIGAVSLYFFGTPPGDRDNSWAQRGWLWQTSHRLVADVVGRRDRRGSSVRHRLSVPVKFKLRHYR
jgi:hypothetical protein